LRDAGYSVEPPETNIVLVEVEEADRFLGALAREGVLATPMSATTVRFCTHLDVADALRTEEVIQGVVQACRRASAAVQQPA
jgi:threonine aldolase